MFRKLMMLTGLAVVGGVVVFGAGVVGHVRQAVGTARAAVEDSLPIDYELKRAEKLIEEVVPEIRACRRTVAEEEVEIAWLEREVADLTQRQGEAGERLRVRNAALKEGQSVPVIGGVRFARTALESEVARGLSRLRAEASLLDGKERLLEARRRSLEAARAKLQKVVDEKARLETLVQKLHAELREAEAMQSATGLFTVDDSNLNRAGTILLRCQKRLAVAQRMIENEGLGPALPEETEGASARPLTEEVDIFLAGRESGTSEPAGVAAAEVR